jgi:DNA modification methylase
LDPFAGSGQTLLAAKRCGRRYLGIEREERYVKIALGRLGR